MFVTHVCKKSRCSTFNCQFSKVTQSKIKSVSRRKIVSVMHSCLSTNFILHQIISKLNLPDKYCVQGVCCRWKDIAIQCLQQHQHLVISRNHHIYLDTICDEHISLFQNNNLISSKEMDLEFWQRTLSLLRGIKCVYIDVTTDDDGNSLFPIYKSHLQLLMDYCGQALECLSMPGHKDNEDETFPLTDSLPHLKHMLLGYTTSQVTKNILTACPNLEYLRLNTSFTEWQMLPKGFKNLYSDSEDLNGMNNLLCSPAVQTLEVVNPIVMTSEICYQSYHLSCLKRFGVTIDLNVTNCLTHLARILSFAPVLRQLMIYIRVFDEIEPEVWIKVLSECQSLTSLTVYLNEPTDTENPRINVSLFQDDFAKTIVSKIKKLEYLYVRFHLSSFGLRLLSQLENLQYFHHEIHTEYMSYDNVFDTDALSDFLSSCFDQKLTGYQLDIPEVEPFGEYLILKESFYDFIEKMERKHFVRFHMWQDDRHYDTEIVHPDKIPGMIYVTALGVDEWDLRYPYLGDIEEDEVEENLLIALTDTQSQVENIFVRDTT